MRTLRRTGPVAIALVLVGVFATGAGLGRAVHLSWPDWSRGGDEPPPRESPVLDPSRPIRLAIPAIKVEAPVSRVGLAADGSVAVFRVSSVERFGKARLPVDRVYGDFSRPGLRLITCGGEWQGGSIGYADNIVVFAALVGSREV